MDATGNLTNLMLVWETHLVNLASKSFRNLSMFGHVFPLKFLKYSLCMLFDGLMLFRDRIGKVEECVWHEEN